MDILDVELKPVADWVNDSKRRACVLCDRKFSTFVRKHHCRACGEVICKNCSSHRRVRVSSAPSTNTTKNPPGSAASATNSGAIPGPPLSFKVSRAMRFCNDCISPVLVDTASAMMRQSMLSMPPPLSHSASLAPSSQSTNADYNDELTRVDVLKSYMILDTFPSPDFEAICHTAAATFECTVAAISFLDASRQWYKARLGIQPPHVPLDVALCSHLLERSVLTPLVVLDTRSDPHFRHNPLVTGSANVRFYAAAPIVNSDGYILGSIFVMDCQPRTTPVEPPLTDMLVYLAQNVMDMLEEFRARAVSRLTVIQEASNEPGSTSTTSSSTTHRQLDSRKVPWPHSGSSTRKSTDQELLMQQRPSGGLATPPDSASATEVPWSATSSGKHAAATAKAIQADTAKCRDKLLRRNNSATDSGGSESGCLGLLCRVTDTQQMLAHQQTFIFERLSLHSARMDRLEASMRSLETAFSQLARRLPPPPGYATSPASPNSEFITI
ncbi:hypothetical protein DYB37_003288 [Aphanomyces astaci]|uniref:FYVE-type domain-containing protein n=1 Tax=Aphanomyces astaci TaxID=112090 RepID=A0A3R6YSN1_APHAT|nr:hypothetical protein DYB35_004639 [Aphanomyces astaci]RHZ23225.1 hypothetical protein DYB37_003288 [Aphanomyces astaci]